MSGNPLSTMGVGVEEDGTFVRYVPPDVNPSGPPSSPLSTMGVGVDETGQFYRYIPPDAVPEPEPPQPPVNLVLPLAGSTSLAQGGTIFTSNGTWEGLLPRTYTYLWRVSPDGAAIPGATNQTWTIAGYEDESIECMVTATNDDGSGTATSNAVGPILPPPP